MQDESFQILTDIEYYSVKESQKLSSSYNLSTYALYTLEIEIVTWNYDVSRSINKQTIMSE